MRASGETSRIAVAAGGLMAGGILLSVAVGLGFRAGEPLVGLLFWSAGLLLVGRLHGLQRVQTLVMLTVGILGLAYGLIAGVEPDWLRAVAGNQALLAMLASVSFLRLISLPTATRDEPDPRGRAALWRTLPGVHLFGACRRCPVSWRCFWRSGSWPRASAPSSTWRGGRCHWTVLARSRRPGCLF